MGIFRKILHREPPDDANRAGPSSLPPEGDEKKNKHDSKYEGSNQEYTPPPGPPPSYRDGQSQSQPTKRYMAPPGPPPVHRDDQQGSYPRAEHVSLSEPQPPQQSDQLNSHFESQYLPPPGPPPSYLPEKQVPVESSKASYEDEPPSYHDWQTAVPDTSLLPPPPVASNDSSATSNADSTQAERAREWCRANALRSAGWPSPQQASASRRGAVKLISPGPGTQSKVIELRQGAWSGMTTKSAADLCFTTSLPLYYVHTEESPKISGKSITAYFEVHLSNIGKPDREGNSPSLAIGFVAAPYPLWRMPGWDRGSLAVHSDDGCRYVNNPEGGLDFVEPFRVGDMVGLGVKYWPGGSGENSSSKLLGEVFFTRNGALEGTWSLQEETDIRDDLGNIGVDGNYDLFGAVGTYGEVAFQAVFEPNSWSFKPQDW